MTPRRGARQHLALLLPSVAALGLLACAHPVPPQPVKPDVIGCIVGRASLAVTAGLVAPIVAGERNGVVRFRVDDCGAPPVLDADEAGRLSATLSNLAVTLSLLAQSSDDACVDAWANAVGSMVVGLTDSIPPALANAGGVEVYWTAPECAP